jgi:hypothetical protein
MTTNPEAIMHEPQSTQHGAEDLVSKADPKYPLLVYNHKSRTTKAAKDQKEFDDLKSKGYDIDPYPPENPDYLTKEDVEVLEGLLHKAAQALAKLGQLSEQQHAQESKEPPAMKGNRK